MAGRLTSMVAAARTSTLVVLFVLLEASFASAQEPAVQEQVAQEHAGGSHDQGMSESTRARAEFEAGRSAFDREEFDVALQHFETAYELSARPGLLFNVGLAAEKLGRSQTAIDAFELFVATEQPSPERAEAEARLSELRNEVATADALTTDDALATDDGGVFSTWWFWTAVAAVVVGAGVTALLLVSGGEEPTGEGGIIWTLTGL